MLGTQGHDGDVGTRTHALTPPPDIYVYRYTRAHPPARKGHSLV